MEVQLQELVLVTPFQTEAMQLQLELEVLLQVVDLMLMLMHC